MFHTWRRSDDRALHEGGFIMIRLTASFCVPIAAALLASTAVAQPQKVENAPNPPNATKVTSDSPGFRALKEGDYTRAAELLRKAHEKDPHDAFAELSLGSAYQELGRMDLAEPLYRQAMTHGQGLYPVEVTADWAKGMTVEQIACRNLEIGLPPAPAGQAKRCQTVLTMGVSRGGKVADADEFNTYFDFNSDVITPGGRANIAAVVKTLMADPAARVVLAGRASKVGSTAYNYELSERRAKAVQAALTAAGVSADRISVTWTGETQLPVPQTESQRQPANRVVEGKIISSGGRGNQ
jgi:outer membrane protein OmpA-like peptidoglycan-associated protein